jgi:hypothetical protein
MRWIMVTTAAIALAASACGGDNGGGDTGGVSRPLSIDEIAQADAGAVTLDLHYYPGSAHALFHRRVYEEAGLHWPVGMTDKNLILYGLASCDTDSPPVPAQWEPLPGDTQADVETVAEAARDAAAEILCP